MSAALQVPHAPIRIGDFETVSVLGAGGSGTVYLATEGATQVAVKVLNLEAELSPKDQQRFVDEAARMRRVTHPNLVQLLASGELPDGRPYLIMPRLQGETLAKRLERGPITLLNALALFDELCEGVAVMHRAGLIHRDIKPENLFVEEARQRLILLDFGIARDLGAPASTTTRSGAIQGTPAFMAPERFFGMGATIASDIYELAVVFFIMLAGRLPWRAEDGATGRLHPSDFRQLGIDVPDSIARVVMRALSTRPEVRPTSVDEFADLLRQAAQEAGSRPNFSDVTQELPTANSGIGLPQPAAEEALETRSRPRGRTALVALLGAGIAVSAAAVWGARSVPRVALIRQGQMELPALKPTTVITTTSTSPSTAAPTSGVTRSAELRNTRSPPSAASTGVPPAKSIAKPPTSAPQVHAIPLPTTDPYSDRN